MAAQSEEGEHIDMQRGDRVRQYDADKDRDRKRTREAGNEAGEGAAIGGGVGAILGGVGGLLVGLGTLVIPGLGVIAAAGPLAGALAGALAGGAAGGIVGALIGLGIPEEEAVVYEEGVRRGGTLVVLQTEDNRVRSAEHHGAPQPGECRAALRAVATGRLGRHGETDSRERRRREGSIHAGPETDYERRR
jgi:hypothetical protein